MYTLFLFHFILMGVISEWCVSVLLYFEECMKFKFKYFIDIDLDSKIL